MGQQDSAMFCIKFILRVEPNDPHALYLRGHANEIRIETFHMALKDYSRALELSHQIADKKT